MKILFTIRSLDASGAERQLTNLARSLQQRGYEIHVAVFYGNGFFQHQLETAGIKIHHLQKKSRWDILRCFKNYIALVKNLAPQTILCYLPLANIISIFGKPFFPQKTKVVYGVRASYMDLSKYETIDVIISWLEAKLSRFADLIICNSHSAFEHAKNKGFYANKMITIPNGIDVTTFFPDRTLGQKWRKEWCNESTDKIIGIIGRLDPMKDHHTFLTAASILAKKYDEIKFVCVGNGEKSFKEKLENYVNHLGLQDKVIWVPAQNDLNSIYNALDICCLSSSFGESFPNVIGEAMACNIPCIATKVGDAAMIIGDPEQIVPIKDPLALAEKLALYLSKDNSSCNYRSRIVNEFSIAKLAERVETVLSTL